MEGFLQVNGSSSNLPGSPTNSFIADEVASICPLITPSPPTNDLINPLPDSTDTNFAIGNELATILQHHVQDNKDGGDSASSSSSALAEPACTQLLNHRNNYHHITKTEETASSEETSGKIQPLQLTFRNPPENYFFMSWNWPLIRKISLWMFLAGLVAMVALVIAMISSLPKKCNPETEWYQGNVIYEIFPASFSDSNQDMIGDFVGIVQKIDYLAGLGVAAVRLNSIFATKHYPEDYKNVTSLLEIAPSLGDLQKFDRMAQKLKARNISLILDLPVYSAAAVKHHSFLKMRPENFSGNNNEEPSVEFLKTRSEQDEIEEALIFWTNHGVDGFYLKGLESFTDSPTFPHCLRKYKKILGSSRPLIVSKAVLDQTPPKLLNILLNNVDLIDIVLEIEKGVGEVSKQLERIANGTLFSSPGLPWVHWSLGDVSTPRLADILPYGNGTLGATLLQLMLPGTPSIFYGNEIGLQGILDPEGDRRDLQHLHQLTAMSWQEGRKKEVLSWLHGDATQARYEQVELVARMARLREESPAIYVNSVFKQGDNKANAEVKYSRKDLLVIQRWYPRRRSYVVVSNLGRGLIEDDLSSLLYSGEVVIGPRVDSKPGSVSFKEISLWPGESVVISLD